MTLPAEAQYRVLLDPTVKYDNYNSFTETDSHFIIGSKNLLTTARGLVSNRPGFATLLESSKTVFTGTVRRMYQWKRWDSSPAGLVGTYIWMACETNEAANTSKVYAYRIGVDSSFQLIWTCSTSSECFDFVEFNNHVGFGNGVAGNMKKYDGQTVTNWGITAPASAPTVDVSSTAGTLTTYSTNGYDWVYTYYNANTGHESSPSSLSSCSGQFTNKTAKVTVTASSDPQVTHIILYRTTDGGSTDTQDMRMVGASVTAYANVTQTISDQVADTSLSADQFAPESLRNDPPPAMMGMAMSPSGRIFGFNGNTVYYSGREEISNGVREECFPSGLDGNSETYQREITGLASIANGVAVFQADRIDKIEGDTLDSFLFYNLAKRQGARQRDAICEFGGICFWLDSGNTIWMLGGDNVGQPITPDIANIDHSQACLRIHLRDASHWLLLLDGANNTIYPMDFDTRNWMPPWILPGAKSLCSGEISAGNYQLAVGDLSHGVYTGSTSTYTDAGTPIDAVANFNLFPIAPEEKPNLSGVVDHIAVTASRIPDTVQYLADDDPTQIGLNASTDPGVPADNITQGQYLFTEFFKVNTPVCNRFSPYIKWTGDGTYGFAWYEVYLQCHPTRS